MTARLKVGLIINPIAGIGGRVALKGSDGLAIQQQAISLGSKPEAGNRTRLALKRLIKVKGRLAFYSVEGAMGGDILNSMGFEYDNCYCPADPTVTTEQDTQQAAKLLKQKKMDIILFAGGDGTARNILEAVGSEQLCLGIPAGCKIFSAVFANTPEQAGDLINLLLAGELVEMRQSEVLDINENAYREGNLKTRVFGEMLTPQKGGYVQSMKISGIESEPLAQQEIAAWVVENFEPEHLYFIGSGSSCMAIKDELAIDGSLLGVDAVINGELIVKDATEQQLLDLMIEYSSLPTQLVITLIGGQGVLFGRGNHQICHQVIRQLGKDNLIVVATKTKIKTLNGKSLAIDTGDQQLNRSLSGYLPIITGYDDSIIYAIGSE